MVQELAAECGETGGDFAADGAQSDDPHGAARQLGEWEVANALPPPARARVEQVPENAATEQQHEADDLFRHCGGIGAPVVRNGDP